MDKRLIAINGQFTNRKLTGQERFAFELLLELDKIVEHSFLRFINSLNQIVTLIFMLSMVQSCNIVRLLIKGISPFLFFSCW